MIPLLQWLRGVFRPWAYMLGGELCGAAEKSPTRLPHRNNDALNTWRKPQIDKRNQRFSPAQAGRQGEMP